MIRTRADALKKITETQKKEDDHPILGNPSDFFSFQPQPDITAYELAVLIKLLDITCQYEAVAKFPKAMRRHFIGVPRGDLGKPAPRRR